MRNVNIPQIKPKCHHKNIVANGFLRIDLSCIIKVKKYKK